MGSTPLISASAFIDSHLLIHAFSPLPELIPWCTLSYRPRLIIWKRGCNCTFIRSHKRQYHLGSSFARRQYRLVHAIHPSTRTLSEPLLLSSPNFNINSSSDSISGHLAGPPAMSGTALE